MKREIIFYDMGRSFYNSSLDFQKKIVEEKISDSSFPDVLIYTEHEPVITLGKRGGEEFIDKSSHYFKEKKPDIIKTSRGGLVTCHMPGQAVIYPVFNLENFNISVREYSYSLMDCIEYFLKFFKINVYKSKEYPGVFVNSKKIGNIGLCIKKNITYHGLSINIKNEKELFDIITPCGLKDIKTTRLIDEIDYIPDMNNVKKLLVESFLEIFGAELSTDKLSPELQENS
ncbi:MAG: lipoyl(octanoyl) transferase [Deltaproteobacteria bacterium]|nr:MAG: lipoyl(octanoyl) transferase [Deltaproteobacteria bacterium]